MLKEQKLCKQDCRSVEGKPPTISATVMIHLLQIAKACHIQACFYCSRDIDFDPMTLMYALNLKIWKVLAKDFRR